MYKFNRRGGGVTKTVLYNSYVHNESNQYYLHGCGLGQKLLQLPIVDFLYDLPQIRYLTGPDIIHFTQTPSNALILMLSKF